MSTAIDWFIKLLGLHEVSSCWDSIRYQVAWTPLVHQAAGTAIGGFNMLATPSQENESSWRRTGHARSIGRLLLGTLPLHSVFFFQGSLKGPSDMDRYP